MALVLGVVGGAVAAAAAGARRTDSAYVRFGRAERAADEIVYNSPNPEQAPIDIRRVVRLPQVVEAGLVKYFGIDSQDTNAYASVDGHAFSNRGINQLKILRGRAARPDRADEAVADFVLADAHHLRVGQRYIVRFFRADDTDMKGPTVPVTFRLVGVAAVPGQFPPQTAKGYLADPPVYLTPAFYAQQGKGFLSLDLAAVRLRHGTTAAFERALAALSPSGPPPSSALDVQAKVVRRAIHLQAIALWLLAGLIGVLWLLLCGQLVARQAGLQASENPALRAIGMTRRQLMGVAGTRALAAGGIGALAALATAAALSTFMPIGAARLAEPHPGFFLDWVVLGAVVAGLALVPVLTTLWPAWRAAGTDRESARAQLRPATLPGMLARAGFPPTITSGARLALEPGRGRGAVPVRSSVLSAALGLLALATAVTFGSNLTHLLHTPRQYGVTWDAEILHTDGPFAVEPALKIAAADPDVAGVAWESGAPVRVGRIEADAHLFDVTKGDIKAPVLHGRLPATPNEIAFGRATMHRLGVAIGDHVPVRAWSDAGRPHTMKVVGEVVLSPGAGGFADLSNLGEGSAMTLAGLRAATPPDVRVPHPYVVAVSFRAGVDPVRARAALWRRLGGPPTSPSGFVVQTPATPVALVDFGHVRRLPLLVGAVLALMAALTIAHVLVSAIRRRRVDLAVLKTLGFTSRQVRVTVAWQASVLATAAVVIGLPLGVGAAHLVWAQFARQIGVLSDLRIPWLLLALIGPAAIAASNLMALIPAVVAGRVPPAVALRSE
jgi:hypothetical protein